MYIIKRFLGDKFNKFNKIIEDYSHEQNEYINLTACTSYPFQEVLDVLAMPLSTIPTEGTRGNRYFPNVSSLDEIENYAEQMCLELLAIKDNTYKVSIQPNSGTQANQIIFNAILSEGDTVVCLHPKDGGHISHTRLGCRNLKPVYISLDSNYDIEYDSLERCIVENNPKLIIIGASSYIKEFDYQKIHSISSRYSVPIMADICHSVLYVMGRVHKDIFPYVDFATFTMDKLLCGPQGGVIVYKTEYDKQICSSIFPKTQGGPIQNIMFAKTMCFLKLSSINVKEYANSVIDNADIMIDALSDCGIQPINKCAHNHIILIDVTKVGLTGAEAEKLLYANYILTNRNQVPGDALNPLITSGIRLGVTTLTNLNYHKDDIRQVGECIATVLKRNDAEDYMTTIRDLIKKYHIEINISS